MKTLMKSILASLILTGLMVTVQAQSPKMKMTTPIPESISTPDKVETSIGTMNYFDGVPTQATVDMSFDFLDKANAYKAFLSCLPTVSVNELRMGQASVGAKNVTKSASMTS